MVFAIKSQLIRNQSSLFKTADLLLPASHETGCSTSPAMAPSAPCYNTTHSILIGRGLLAAPPSNMACATTTLEEVRLALILPASHEMPSPQILPYLLPTNPFHVDHAPLHMISRYDGRRQ
jgi:hypothetical protein